MSWVLPGAGFDEVFALRPELAEAWRRFHDLFAERRLVEPRILELCRLRVAQLHGCEDVLAGARAEERAELAAWRESPRFSAAERAALAFAEAFVRDVQSVTDEDAAAVVAALGDAGTVALAEALALFDGFDRFRLVLGIRAEHVRERG